MLPPVWNNLSVLYKPGLEPNLAKTQKQTNQQQKKKKKKKKKKLPKQKTKQRSVSVKVNFHSASDPLWKLGDMCLGLNVPIRALLWK